MNTCIDFSNLPDWLPKKLAEAGLTPEEFANQLEVSRTTVYNYISDDSRPSEEIAVRMSRILGVTSEELSSQYLPKKVGQPQGDDPVHEIRMRERKTIPEREEPRHTLLQAQEAMRQRIRMAPSHRGGWCMKKGNQMSQVHMEAHGRFGQMLAAAVSRERLSLRDLAAKLQYTYEQMRKLWIGTSGPSPLLLVEICRFLHMDFDKAKEAANADCAERKFGTTALTMLGRDPRLADIEELLPQLSEQEWNMFVAQIRFFVHQKRMS